VATGASIVAEFGATMLRKAQVVFCFRFAFFKSQFPAKRNNYVYGANALLFVFFFGTIGQLENLRWLLILSLVAHRQRGLHMKYTSGYFIIAFLCLSLSIASLLDSEGNSPCFADVPHEITMAAAV
jgi:hypothetical protein